MQVRAFERYIPITMVNCMHRLEMHFKFLINFRFICLSGVMLGINYNVATAFGHIK